MKFRPLHDRIVVRRLEAIRRVGMQVKLIVSFPILAVLLSPVSQQIEIDHTRQRGQLLWTLMVRSIELTLLKRISSGCNEDRRNQTLLGPALLFDYLCFVASSHWLGETYAIERRTRG